MEDTNSHKKNTHFNIYYYDAQLAIAYQADCENLLQKFKEKQNCSFAAFAKLWRENCFMGIFQDQEYILMLQTFLENCFFVTKKFLFSSDLYTQVGAVYVLYGLYYKQPIREWVKIRLTKPEADKLNEIIEIHKVNKYLDVVFIYSKMRIDGAFQYCALGQPLGLEARFLRRQDLSGEEINSKSSKHNPLQKFKTLMEQDPDLVQFDETEDEYQKLANKFKNKTGKLFVFSSEIGNEMKKAYSELFQVDLEGCREEKLGEQDRLKATKIRAMSNANATYRGEKAVITAMDLDTPSTSKRH